MTEEEQIEEAKELARLFFTDEEIMEILEVSCLSPKIERAIRASRLLSEAKIRKSIVDLANNGSSVAQAYAVKMIESLKRKSY